MVRPGAEPRYALVADQGLSGRSEMRKSTGMEATGKYFVADLVEEVGSLPSVAAQIVAMTSDPECDISKMTKVILSDNVMTMRFLALANTAAMGRGQEIRNLRGALVRLGLRRVRNVSLCMGMHDMLPVGHDGSKLRQAEFWKHNLATACCAQGLAKHRGRPSLDDAWLVGILHRIGVAALDQKAGPQFQAALELAREKRLALAEAELEILEFHHGELGARILKNWHLPEVFVDVLEYYPGGGKEGEASAEAQELIKTLRDAIAIVRSIGFGESGECSPTIPLDKLPQTIDLPLSALENLVDGVDREVREMSHLIGIDCKNNNFHDAFEESKRLVARLGLEGFDEAMALEDLHEQLSLAREIQQRLLPESTPEIPGFNLAALNTPSFHVSGDYYDFFKIKGGRTGLAIADVSGKGMPASLLASNLQASLRALGMVNQDPGELLKLVNEALYESTDAEKFATLFLAVFQPGFAGFHFASAGHPPALLLRADGHAEWLPPAGTPVGLFAPVDYPVRTVEMHPGDLLVAYTDGVTEAANYKGDEFGPARLEKAVRNHRENSPASLIDQIIAQVREHAEIRPDDDIFATLSRGHREVGTAPPPADDLTVVVVQACSP